MAIKSDKIAKVANRLRVLARPEPITAQDCYVVVPRAELRELADRLDAQCEKLNADK